MKKEWLRCGANCVCCDLAEKFIQKETLLGEDASDGVTVKIFGYRKDGKVHVTREEVTETVKEESTCSHCKTREAVVGLYCDQCRYAKPSNSEKETSEHDEDWWHKSNFVGEFDLTPLPVDHPDYNTYSAIINVKCEHKKSTVSRSTKNGTRKICNNCGQDWKEEWDVEPPKEPTKEQIEELKDSIEKDCSMLFGEEPEKKPSERIREIIRENNAKTDKTGYIAGIVEYLDEQFNKGK